ncbi:MAG TPA: dTDP-4-dehydrorhamnose 3,5-epimerase [Microthrixaceae bacterium]|nr:dTDP-4-dehydrorhamnose 3,5-epimerase [Microthrixaceae bacterium]
MALVEESSIIEGVFVVTPDLHGDDRGYFVETYRRQWFPQGREMIQANRGDRISGCIVGLHYHLHQSDYWYVPNGHARVVLHDLRVGSSTDGATQCLDLGEVDGGPNNHLGVYIPPGVAHGFASLSDMTITYLVDGYYNPADELGVAWNDPRIDADWGLSNPILSARDQSNPLRDQLDPQWQPHSALRL